MEDRLSKVIALAGLASRRAADSAVKEGRVTVNGEMVKDPGYRVDISHDHVKFDGKLIPPPSAPVYLVVNKPRGVLAMRADAEGRPTVITLIRGFGGRLLPVGRLDREDEGLLLLTSDSDMAASLSHAKSGVPNTYLIKVRGIPEDPVLDRMRTGVPLEGGRTLPMDVRRVSTTGKNCWLQVEVREVRANLLIHMMMKLRHPVVKVKRTTFGPLSVRGLAPGTFRKVSEPEVQKLKELALNPPGLPARGTESATTVRPEPRRPGAQKTEGIRPPRSPRRNEVMTIPKGRLQRARSTPPRGKTGSG